MAFVETKCSLFPEMCFPTTPFAHFSSFPALPGFWTCVFYYGFPDIGQRCEHFVETVCLISLSMCFPSTPFPYFFCRVSSPLFVALATGCLGPSWGLLGPVLGHLGGRVGPLLGHLGAVLFLFSIQRAATQLVLPQRPSNSHIRVSLGCVLTMPVSALHNAVVIFSGRPNSVYM